MTGFSTQLTDAYDNGKRDGALAERESIVAMLREPSEKVLVEAAVRIVANDTWSRAKARRVFCALADRIAAEAGDGQA